MLMSLKNNSRKKAQKKLDADFAGCAEELLIKAYKYMRIYLWSASRNRVLRIGDLRNRDLIADLHGINTVFFLPPRAQRTQKEKEQLSIQSPLLRSQILLLLFTEYIALLTPAEPGKIAPDSRDTRDPGALGALK